MIGKDERVPNIEQRTEPKNQNPDDPEMENPFLKQNLILLFLSKTEVIINHRHIENRIHHKLRIHMANRIKPHELRTKRKEIPLREHPLYLRYFRSLRT